MNEKTNWQSAPHRVAVGRLGEDAALVFLENLGYTLMHRNWRSGRFELDLVVRSPEGILVFVEVKANRTLVHGSPGERVDGRKQNRIQRVAQCYTVKYGLSDSEMRFDVIGIENGTKGIQITHYPNAFLPANSGYFGI